MKTVLCYGDSLTWGFNAEGGRHAFEDRWPSVLQASLDNSVRAIAEGLNGRTTAFDDYVAGADRNGARILPTVVMTHMPIDLIIFLLGTNDMKPWIHGNPMAANSVFNFFSLAGDANHDRKVDITDLAIFTLNWQTSPGLFSNGDFDQNGTVDAFGQHEHEVVEVVHLEQVGHQ